MAETIHTSNALTEDDLRRAKTDLFIALPQRVYDAFCNGEITPSMFAVMLWLHRRADWSTGKVRQVSSDRIHYETGKQFAVRTFQDALANLHSCGWITSHYVQGNKGSYWVTINNYTALTGALKNQLLNPKEVKAYAKGQPVDCVEGCDENSSDDSSESSSDDSSDGAPIQRLQSPSEKEEIATSQQQQRPAADGAEPTATSESKPAGTLRLDRETFLFEQRMEWDEHNESYVSYKATLAHEDRAFALAERYGLDAYLDGLVLWLRMDAGDDNIIGRSEDGDEKERDWTLVPFLNNARYWIEKKKHTRSLEDWHQKRNQRRAYQRPDRGPNPVVTSNTQFRIA